MRSHPRPPWHPARKMLGSNTINKTMNIFGYFLYLRICVLSFSNVGNSPHIARIGYGPGRAAVRFVTPLGVPEPGEPL